MWGRAVRDLYAELPVITATGLSQRSIPEIVRRCLAASGQNPELPDESLVARALFERAFLYLLYVSQKLSELGSDDFIGVCCFLNRSTLFSRVYFLFLFDYTGVCDSFSFFLFVFCAMCQFGADGTDWQRTGTSVECFVFHLLEHSPTGDKKMPLHFVVGLVEMLLGQDRTKQLDALKSLVGRIVGLQSLLGIPADRQLCLYKIACLVSDGAAVNQALLDELNKVRREEFDSQPRYRGKEFVEAKRIPCLVHVSNLMRSVVIFFFFVSLSLYFPDAPPPHPLSPSPLSLLPSARILHTI